MLKRERAYGLWTSTTLTAREIGEILGGVTRQCVMQYVKTEAKRRGTPYPYRNKTKGLHHVRRRQGGAQ